MTNKLDFSKMTEKEQALVRIISRVALISDMPELNMVYWWGERDGKKIHAHHLLSEMKRIVQEYSCHS